MNLRGGRGGDIENMVIEANNQLFFPQPFINTRWCIDIWLFQPMMNDDKIKLEIDFWFTRGSQ